MGIAWVSDWVMVRAVWDVSVPGYLIGLWSGWGGISRPYVDLQHVVVMHAGIESEALDLSRCLERSSMLTIKRRQTASVSH